MTTDMARQDLAAQLREILAARGITSIPYQDGPADMPHEQILVSSTSTVSRRHLLADLDDGARARRVEEAETYGVDLDGRDTTTVSIPRPHHSTWSDTLTYGEWLEHAVSDLDPRYDLHDLAPTARTVELHERLQEAERSVADLRAQRDQAVRDAISSGISAYRVAQVLGISQQAVAKIRRG